MNTCKGCGVALGEGVEMFGVRLVPNYCEACLDAMKIREEQARNHSKRFKAEETWELSVPCEYRSSRPEIIPNQSAMRKVMEWTYGSRGLLIGGPSRRGKTRSAVMLMRRLAVGELRSCQLFLDNSFAHECSSSWGNNDGVDWIRSVQASDVVLLDDLGKFKMTERVESELYGMIEHFTSWGKPLIVTMNAGVEELKARMSVDRGEPLLRRLREFCEPVAF